MNIEKLYEVIEEYRKLNERSSLPIYIKKANQVIWFNYTINYEERICMTTNIFVADVNFNDIKKIPQNLISKLNTIDGNKELLDEEEYYSQLDGEFLMSEIYALISRTEEASFISLYKQVVDFVSKS